jgi:hypothetical protein
MLRIGKLQNKPNMFFAEEFELETDGEKTVFYNIENITWDGVNKLLRGKRVMPESLELALSLIQNTRYPATLDNNGVIMGVVEGNC